MVFISYKFKPFYVKTMFIFLLITTDTYATDFNIWFFKL